MVISEPSSLSFPWIHALQQVSSRRSKLHDKPAALLAALDILDEKQDGEIRIPYSRLRQRFASLLAEVDPRGADKAAQPFYHLATGEQIWTLWRDGKYLDAGGMNPNAIRAADEARFRDELRGVIAMRSGRQAVREAVLDMLREDDDPICLALVEEYQKRSDLTLAETPGEIRRSLIRFNVEALQYLPFVRELASATTFWVYDPDSDLFGPSKFVGFKSMDATRYLHARTVTPKGRFDGHTTRMAIERVLGETFGSDAELEVGVEAWMARLTGNGDSSIDPSKLRFVRLPTSLPEASTSDLAPDPFDSAAFSNYRISDLLEDPPAVTPLAPQTLQSPRPARIDWASRDAANRRIGASAEQFVARLERQFLIEAGRPDLAQKVEVVAQTQGDGLGYDVLSFTPEDTEKYIEVKATTGGKETPFILTEHERLRAEILGERIWLYRLFRTSTQWRLFRLQGPFSKSLNLHPTHYRATVSADN